MSLTGKTLRKFNFLLKMRNFTKQCFDLPPVIVCSGTQLCPNRLIAARKTKLIAYRVQRPTNYARNTSLVSLTFSENGTSRNKYFEVTEFQFRNHGCKCTKHNISEKEHWFRTSQSSPSARGTLERSWGSRPVRPWRAPSRRWSLGGSSANDSRGRASFRRTWRRCWGTWWLRRSRRHKA